MQHRANVLHSRFIRLFRIYTGKYIISLYTNTRDLWLFEYKSVCFVDGRRRRRRWQTHTPWNRSKKKERKGKKRYKKRNWFEKLVVRLYNTWKRRKNLSCKTSIDNCMGTSFWLVELCIHARVYSADKFFPVLTFLKCDFDKILFYRNNIEKKKKPRFIKIWLF